MTFQFALDETADERSGIPAPLDIGRTLIRSGRKAAASRPTRSRDAIMGVNGKPFGEEVYAAYQKPEGQVTEVATWGAGRIDEQAHQLR